MPGLAPRGRADPPSALRTHVDPTDELEDVTAASHTSSSPLLNHPMRRNVPAPRDEDEDETLHDDAQDALLGAGAAVNNPIQVPVEPGSGSRHPSRSAVEDASDEESSSAHLLEHRMSSPGAFLDDADDPIDNSPYAQVRASVKARDDLTLSVDTPRMWFLSLLFAVFGSGTNLFFSLRYPSVTIAPIIALLLVHPLGLLWDGTFKRSDDPPETFANGSLDRQPAARFSDGASTPLSGSFFGKRRLGERARLFLAQGRWNEKEHACVYIASNVSFGFAFATDVSSVFRFDWLS